MSTGLFLAILLSVFLGLSIAMGLAWMVWRRTRNSGWVDVVWTFGVGALSMIIVMTLQSAESAATSRLWIVFALVLVWTLRLGLHIAVRTSSVADDPRYAKLIQGWGKNAKVQMFWLLQKQAWVSIPLVLAIVLAAANPVPMLRLQDWLGAVLLLTAIAGETVADRQLRRFRSRNGGDVCQQGLWAWSRHPNYFFQWLGWLAYPLIAITLDGSYVWGWLSLAAPLCMYWLLLHVSGIPPLEEHMLETRGNKYRAYMARTSAFFPLPPRSYSTS